MKIFIINIFIISNLYTGNILNDANTKKILKTTDIQLENSKNKKIGEKSLSYHNKYYECISNKGTISNMIIYECSNKISSIVMIKMDKLYKKIYKSIIEESNSDAKIFKKSQDAWVFYRDTHCKLMGNYVGTPMYNYCPMKLNINRLNELKELAHE